MRTILISDSDVNVVRTRSVSFSRTNGVRKRLYVMPERDVAAKTC
jgi:hypothetical protein